MRFEFEPLPAIDGAFVMLRKVYQDDRGTFGELLREGMHPLPFPEKFVQQNASYSEFGVLRGMHLQRNDPQGKLVTCLLGEVLDVIIDLRPESPTFLRTASLRLNWQNGEALYSPPGCAHGFLSLSRMSVVHYNCTSFYNPEFDGGVRWDSPEIVEHFGHDLVPILSAKDRSLPTVKEYLKELETNA